jgi:hypothetical protein
MNLTTKRGEFPDFAQLRAAYLKSDDGQTYWLDPGPFCQDEWKSELMHISELGGCPREVAYRLTGVPEKPRSEASKANMALMFFVGYRVHHISYSAMNWAGILVKHEYEVELPFPWTGRGDALFLPDYEKDETWAYDMKTVLPAAIKYSYEFPKPKDTLQLGGYNAAPMGVVEYADRGGQNTPVVCEVNVADWHGKAVERMGVFDAMWDALPDLPPILPPVLTGSYWKARGENRRDLKTISLGPDWRCSYCSRHLHLKDSGTQASSSCHPYFKPPEVVAEFKNTKLIRCTKGHEDGVAAWLGSHVTSYQIEEEGE